MERDLVLQIAIGLTRCDDGARPRTQSTPKSHVGENTLTPVGSQQERATTHDLRLSSADLQEIRNDARTREPRMLSHSLVTRIRLGDALDQKTRIEDEIEPLAQRPSKPWHSERLELVP